MNGTNRPLVKPKRRLVSFTTYYDDDDGRQISCAMLLRKINATNQPLVGFTTQIWMVIMMRSTTCAISVTPTYLLFFKRNSIIVVIKVNLSQTLYRMSSQFALATDSFSCKADLTVVL